VKLAIMQPYFMPYIGYFQLIGAADVFVLYDNIKYTKKGWINRNRFLRNGADAMFSLPLKKDSDFLDVGERELAEDFNRDKFLNQLRGAYARAPHFKETLPLLEQIVRFEDHNLFRFIHHSIVCICRYLDIRAEIRISSHISINHELKSQDKVIALCQELGADNYINSIGGIELYAKEEFRVRGIELHFLKTHLKEYTQFGDPFVPWLSIVDVLMFNPIESIIEGIRQGFELI